MQNRDIPAIEASSAASRFHHDALIHLVGHGYGAEPPTVDDAFGRVSYTQFEFLHAQQRAKRTKGRFKTQVIFAEDGCTRNTPPEERDLPRDAAHPAPATYQSERHSLQDAWRVYLKSAGHLRHPAASDTDLDLQLNKLNNEFDKLRSGFRLWQKVVLIGLLIVVAGVAEILWRQKLNQDRTDREAAVAAAEREQQEQE